MKKLIYLLLIPIFFNSCEKYEEPTSLSLSGEYVIDKITYSKIDNAPSPDDSVYLPGTIYVNPLESFPMDTIRLGFTKWHFDYSIISILVSNTYWSYPYTVINHNSNYDLGYIDFNCEGSRRVFKILDDQMESITLRSSGAWGYGQIGPDVSLTLHLTRVGP